jgi:hypothetical protein
MNQQTPSITRFIRSVAQALTTGPITDFEIATVAKSRGWSGPVVDDINTLEFIDRFTLGKHMLGEAERAGFTREQLGKMM